MTERADAAAGADGILWEGRFLRMVRRGGWECVDRPRVSGLVGIIPVTADGELVLIEQRRPPVGAVVVELPAGAAGDEPGCEHEPLAEAARRELLEETGFVAEVLTPAFDGVTSPGLTSEHMHWFLATGLRRVHAGGGHAGESIRVTPVPLGEVARHLERRRAAGCAVDLRIYAALWLCAQSGLTG